MAVAIALTIGAGPVRAETDRRDLALPSVLPDADLLALATEHDFAIPAQSLGSALIAFTKITGIELVSDARLTEDRLSVGAVGRMTAEAALRRILDGHRQLRFRFTSTNVVAVTGDPETTGQINRSEGTIALDEVSVEGDGGRGSGRAAGQPPPTGTIGQPPPPYAGGQVASGGRVGFLGNRSVFDTPFTQNNYTEQLIRDQQALTVADVFSNDPAVRVVNGPFGLQPAVFIRGFLLDSREFAFDGLYGLTSYYRPAIEGIERIEILHGPGAFLYGFPPSGNVGGVVNFIPKRAPDAPITRVTGQYLSNATFGGAVDVARRFGEGNALGLRINGAYRDGPTPIDRNAERFGVLALGLDYRGDRLRLSADIGYQNFSNRAPPFGFGVRPGFDIPRAPSLTSNVQQPWERTESSHAFAVGRAEYDVTDTITVFAAIGGSKTKNDLIYTFSTITDGAGTLSQLTNRYVEEVEQWTAETGIRARFSTGFIEHEAAVVGTHYESFRPFGFFFGPTFASNLYDPVFVPRPVLPSERNIPRTLAASELDGVAVTDTMSVLDGRIQVFAGGRFQRAQRSSTTSAGAVTAYDETAATPMAAMIVKPLTNLSLYASYAEGFGFGPTPPPQAQNKNAVFPPVITTQIETGAKLDLGTLGATVAFYEITRPSGFIDQLTGLFGLNGEQRNRGMDLNLFGEPVPGLRVLGGISLIDGILIKTEGGKFDGNVAPSVPDMQLNLGGEIDLPPWLASGVTVNGRVIYTARQFSNPANTQSIPDYTRLDLGVRYKFDVDGTPLVARFNVLNVTGNDYFASTGFGLLQLGTPRTFLFSFSADL